MPAAKKSPVTLLAGCNAVSAGRGGTAVPTGEVHLVDGWQPVCGEDRVRFVFPGRAPESADGTCPRCVRAATPARPVRRPRAS